MYRITEFGVTRLSDGANIIQDDSGNSPDWNEYLAWVIAGGVPEPMLTLESARNRKIEDINQAAGDELIGGFWSNGSGQNCFYDTDIEDQLNMIGAVLANEDTYYRCFVEGIEEKQWVPHTAAQLRQVFDDGKLWKTQILQKASQLKSLAKSATTFAELDSIQW